MTGLFQIFDRYRALSRSKSVPKKVTTGSHGKSWTFTAALRICIICRLPLRCCTRSSSDDC